METDLLSSGIAIGILTIGLLGIVGLLFIKKFWIGGIVTVSSFAVYFMLFGTGGWIYLFALCLGLLLLVLEVVVPSFGVLGIVGPLLTLFGVYFGSMNPMAALFNFSIAMLISIAVAILLVKIGFKLNIGKQLVLDTTLSTEEGYRVNDKDYSRLLYQSGVTTTSLRPIGRAKFGDEVVEVMTSDEMIEPSTKVVVYKVENQKIIVKKEND